MSKEDLHEKIEDYIKGRLSDQDRKGFERTISDDKTLQEEVAIHRDLMTATGEQDIIELRQQMKSYFDPPAGEEASKPDRTAPAKSVKPWWLLLLLPLFALLWFYWEQDQPVQPAAIPTPSQQQETPVPPLPANIPIASDDTETNTESTAIPSNTEDDKLMAEETSNSSAASSAAMADNNQEYLALATSNFVAPGSVLIRSGEEAAKSKLELAQEAYNEGLNATQAASRKLSFQKCLSLLSAAKTAPKNAVQYLRAHAYFQLGEYKKAAADFELLSDDFDYGYNADWGHLLSLIAQGASQKAAYSAIMEKLTKTSSHSFHQKALDIQEKLKKIEK